MQSFIDPSFFFSPKAECSARGSGRRLLLAAHPQKLPERARGQVKECADEQFPPTAAFVTRLSIRQAAREALLF